MFYIGGRRFVCQIIEPVTFVRLYLHCGILHWADIYIHVETFRTFTADVRPEIYIYIYIYTNKAKRNLFACMFVRNGRPCPVWNSSLLWAYRGNF